MSQRLSDKIAQIQRQKEEEAEYKRVKDEKKKQEHDEKVKKERERQQEKLRRLNTSESLGIECKFAVEALIGVWCLFLCFEAIQHAQIGTIHMIVEFG